MDQLNDNTSQTPDIDGGSVVINFDVFKHVFMGWLFVLEQNVVKKLRTHVLRSGQLVLFKAFEDKWGAIIDEFELIFFVALWLFEENVFSLDVGMDDFVQSQQVKSLCNGLDKMF